MTSLFPSRTSQMRGAGCDAAGLGAVGWYDRTADECGAVATRKAMMFAAAPAGQRVPAPPNEAMTISQPSTYNRKAGCLPQRPQDHHRTGKRPSPDSGDSRTPQASLPVSQPDVVGTELGHR